MRPKGPVEWGLLALAITIVVRGSIDHMLTTNELYAAVGIVALIWPKRVDQARHGEDDKG